VKKLLLTLLCLPLVYSCQFKSQEKEDETNISNVYSNSEHNLSFRYTSNWKQQQPQLASTLCLFYEKQLNASCNVSFIKAERNNVEKYDEKYMSTLANGAFNEVNNLTVRFESLMGRKFSICTIDFQYPMTAEGETINGKSIFYTTNRNGNRYMMTFTVPAENYDLLKSEIYAMGSTLFIK
tara:strand:- start:663 stop:1205 length:543 start_codon:yes stop_codon:yes gene_type:complete